MDTETDFFKNMSIDEFKLFLERARGFMSYYRCAILELETKFRVLDEQFSFSFSRNPIENIKSRLKSPESIQAKLKKRNIPFSLKSIEDNLFDIAGLRVICTYIDDIYNLADCLISQDDVRLIEKKDYIKNPKPNGYRSLHLIVEIPIFIVGEKKLVKAEVQLRTVAMESWSNVEHSLCYKKDFSPELKSETSKKLLEYADNYYKIDIGMQELREKVEQELYE